MLSSLGATITKAEGAKNKQQAAKDLSKLYVKKCLSINQQTLDKSNSEQTI
jgi:hypothetical protein